MTCRRLLAACVVIGLAQVGTWALARSEWGGRQWAVAVRLGAMVAVLGAIDLALMRGNAASLADAIPPPRAAAGADGQTMWRGVGTGLALGGLMAAGNLVAAARGLPMPRPRVPFGPETVGLAPVIVVVSVLAPLAEECFFRGILLRYVWEKRGAVAGVLVSAGAFALAHGEPYLMWPAALGGLILGVGYVRSRSLATPIIAHVMANLSYVILRNMTP